MPRQQNVGQNYKTDTRNITFENVVKCKYLEKNLQILQFTILNQWCVCVRSDGPYTHTTGSKLRCQIPTKHKTNICETLRIFSVKYSFIVPDGGSHRIRNMLEWFLILCLLTLRLLILYIYGAHNKARNANVVYIWTYVWQRWNSLFLFAAQCFNTESMQRGFLCHICV